MALSDIWNRVKRLARPGIIGWAFVALGVLLRLRQYLANLSITGDEASLAMNILDRSMAGLVKPLAFEQGAPLFFLFAEKLATLLLGSEDLVLRLFPVLCGLAAMVAMYIIAREHFGWAGLAALFGLAISIPSIFYTAYVKQYSGDVFFALLLLYLAGRCLRQPSLRWDLVYLGMAGVIAVWFSHPAIFVLAAVGITLLVDGLAREPVRLPLAPLGLGAAWLISFGLSYWLSVRYLTSNAFLNTYWQYAYMPLPPWSQPRWFADTYLAMLNVSLRRTDMLTAIVSLVLVVPGGISLVRRRWQLALLLLSQFVFVLGAAALQKYPLDDRFLLFLVPSFLFLMAEGAAWVVARLSDWNRAAAAFAAAIMIYVVLWAPALAAYRNFRYLTRPWDIRPVMQHVRDHWQPGQAIYVSGGGRAPEYYAARYGLEHAEIVYQTTHRIVGWWKFKRQVTRILAKEPVWVVFAHLETPKDDRYVKFLYHTGAVQDDFQSSDARGLLLMIGE